MIILFDRNEKKFTTLGIGVLKDARSCAVKEALNGEFTLEMEYPVDGQHYEDIQQKRIILAKPNPYMRAQPFRINSIERPIDGVVTVSAEHISYDLSGLPVKELNTEDESFQNETNKVQAAFDSLKKNSALPMPFNFVAELTSKVELNTATPANARSMLAGSSGSILETYGGEFIFDQYDVKLVKNRGYDRGFSIKYGKNMTDLEQDIDGSKLYTGVYPYYFVKESKTVTSKKMQYRKVYIVPNSEPYRAGWLTAVDSSTASKTAILTAFLDKLSPVIISADSDYVYNNKTYNVNNQVFIYTTNDTDGPITVTNTDNNNVTTTITVESGKGYYKRVDTEYIRVYTKSDSETFSKSWLSNKEKGNAITPEAGKLYQVWSEGLYYLYIYAWIEKLNKYMQVGASTVYAYIKNINVKVKDSDMEKGLSSYAVDELVTTSGSALALYDNRLYKIIKDYKDGFSKGTYYYDKNSNRFIKSEPDARRDSEWLSKGSPTQSAIDPAVSTNVTYVINNSDLVNQNGESFKNYTYIWVKAENKDEGQYYLVSKTKVYYPPLGLTSTETIESNNSVYIPEGIIYLGSVDTYIRDAEQYSKDWLSLTSGGEAISPEEGVPYRIVNEGSDLKYHTFYWTGTKYVAADSEDSPIVQNIYSLDCSNEFDAKPTEDELRTKAQELIKDSDVGQLTESVTVSFTNLSESSEYAHLKAFEQVELGDIVHVEYSRLGVKTLLKVITTEYNVLTGRYNSIEMGTTKATIVNSIVCKNDNISSLTNDKGYTDQTTVNELIAKNITAEFIKAQNAELSQAQIDQLSSGQLNVDGNINITRGSINIQNEENNTQFSVSSDGNVIANSVEIKGHVEADSGKIAGFDINSDGLTKGTDGADNYVYLGPKGIKIGKEKFEVDDHGNVKANGFLTWNNVTQALTEDTSHGVTLNEYDGASKFSVEAINANHGRVGPLKISGYDLDYIDATKDVINVAFHNRQDFLHGYAHNCLNDTLLYGGVVLDNFAYHTILGGADYGLGSNGGLQVCRVYKGENASGRVSDRRVFNPNELGNMIILDKKDTSYKFTSPIKFGTQSVTMATVSSTNQQAYSIDGAHCIYAAWCVDDTNWTNTCLAISWTPIGNTIKLYSGKTDVGTRKVHLFYIYN